MRGKVYAKHLQPETARITPAYAGKRLLCRRSTALVQDHPRLCGEKVLCGFFDVSAQGSPPPMRGKEHKG